MLCWGVSADAGWPLRWAGSVLSIGITPGLMQLDQVKVVCGILTYEPMLCAWTPARRMPNNEHDMLGKDMAVYLCEAAAAGSGAPAGLLKCHH